MEFAGGDLPGHQHDERRQKNRGADEIAQFRVIVTVSPPVSPSVVAAILMIQKLSVTSGTLLRTPSAALFMSSRS